MSSLRYLSFPNCHFSSLNLDRWWKCNVSLLNSNRRIDKLKWHPLIWTPVYVYNSYWRLLRVFISLTLQTLYFTLLRLQKLYQPSSFSLCRNIFLSSWTLKFSTTSSISSPPWSFSYPLLDSTIHDWEALGKPSSSLRLLSLLEEG